ncbi:MAG: Asp-tRNA(Asn)/Glu-tRNA(Gln) amidotransferase subunit GatB, partial [Planctomycetes bacterium]|nr:Asp-tRNA(Asn)/Glu-tRNA(Gln) amidotransferase subunit GatB [Planctomycetota bacterium]
NYQISQYDKPLTYEGRLPIVLDGTVKEIRIRRAHLEEDTGKLVHLEDGTSGVDFNRAGVPLLEIVSEPDMHSPDEVVEYLTRLKTLLEYLGVSDCNMEEGSMRCEANVDVRPTGGERIGGFVEIKNVASITGVRRAIEYEFERQRDLYESGGTVERETRRWNPDKQRTTVMRTKEEAHDYRYFPEPDLPPITISREWVEEVRAKLPELPEARRDRFIAEYGLLPYDANLLTASRAMADYFEACIDTWKPYPQSPQKRAKAVANWLLGEFSRLLNATGTEIADTRVAPEQLCGLLELVQKDSITGPSAKEVFEEMFHKGGDAADIIARRDLSQISDAGQLDDDISAAIAANEQAVADYKAGKDTALKFLVGQVMKATKGRANPQVASELLKQKLEEV